jgi:hypothetical protein
MKKAFGSLLGLVVALAAYETTGVTETEQRLNIHSLHAKGLGWKAR